MYIALLALGVPLGGLGCAVGGATRPAANGPSSWSDLCAMRSPPEARAEVCPSRASTHCPMGAQIGTTVIADVVPRDPRDDKSPFSPYGRPRSAGVLTAEGGRLYFEDGFVVMRAPGFVQLHELWRARARRHRARRLVCPHE